MNLWQSEPEIRRAWINEAVPILAGTLGAIGSLFMDGSFHLHGIAFTACVMVVLQSVVHALDKIVEHCRRKLEDNRWNS